MECVADHDTTDSDAFPAAVCSFRDLIGDCSLVAMPPVCTQAHFQATWRLPPQFSDFDQMRRLSVTSCAVHLSKFPTACFASGPFFSEVCPQVDFDPTVWRTQYGVSEIVVEFSRVWRSMTCLCQQEILDRLLFPMQHVRKTSPHAGQRPSDRCFSWSLNPQKFVPRSDACAPRVIACACLGTLKYCVVCADVGGDQIIVGVRVTNCLALDMFRLRPMVCFGGCFCMRAVGACNFIGLASFFTFFWSRSLKVFWTVCQQRRHVCSLATARNRCRQCWKKHSLTSDRRLDSPCVIRYACGITTGVLKVRTVVCLVFASFRNNCLSKVGWTRAAHALHRCSFSVQLFRGIVFPRVFSTGFVFVQGVLRFRQVV